jgi:3-phosphoshikimate 1-carboxyvinyltransferase
MPVIAPTRLAGKLCVPGDKSITHRAILFAALCKGECEIVGAGMNEDCQATIRCLQDLGLEIEIDAAVVKIKSAGLAALRIPQHTLDVKNSGTTMRLLTGLLAGANLTCTIDGDESIRKRPMKRIFEPLGLMGAKFTCLDQPNCAPFELQGNQLHAIEYHSPVASAQVEAAFVLAALQAEGQSTIKLPAQVRDHTQRLLKFAGVPIESTNLTDTYVKNLTGPIAPYRLEVPGDLSSAAFLIVAAALLPGSDIVLPGVGINPGRRLIIDTMLKMGANVQIENCRNYALEPVADLHVKYSPQLKGTTISGAEVALGIDEIPILALLGCFCEGSFFVKNAAELRYKESNRLQSMVENLDCAGAAIQQEDDGFEITGSSVLKGGCSWATYGDHRLAMTGIIAGLLSHEPIKVDDTKCVSASYPTFESDLHALSYFST